MKRIFAVLSLVGCLTVPALAERYEGLYYLRMHNLSRFGTDTIKIVSISNGFVTGEVGIDWGIGPEARTPSDFEKFYKLPFRAKLMKDGDGFSFTVKVADRASYAFTFFFCDDRDYKPLLTGFVTMKYLSRKGRYLPGTYGIYAALEAAEGK